MTTDLVYVKGVYKEQNFFERMWSTVEDTAEYISDSFSYATDRVQEFFGNCIDEVREFIDAVEDWLYVRDLDRAAHSAKWLLLSLVGYYSCMALAASTSILAVALAPIALLVYVVCATIGATQMAMWVLTRRPRSAFNDR